NEADPAALRISYQSPVGKALFGRSVGEVVEVRVPAGIIRYEIVRIERTSRA
ncbi:MAG TPA: GreA/GreB family elongation factor, partial [Thermaerobacter sp.]